MGCHKARGCLAGETSPLGNSGLQAVQANTVDSIRNGSHQLDGK